MRKNWLRRISKNSGVDEKDCAKVLDSLDEVIEEDRTWNLPTVILVNVLIIVSFVGLVMRIRRVIHTIR